MIRRFPSLLVLLALLLLGLSMPAIAAVGSGEPGMEPSEPQDNEDPPDPPDPGDPPDPPEPPDPPDPIEPTVGHDRDPRAEVQPDIRSKLSTARAAEERKQVRRAPSGRAEYVLIGSRAELARALVLLDPRESTVIRKQHLSSIGLSMVVVDLGPALSAEVYGRRLADRAVRVALDVNVLFGLAADPRVYAPDLVSGSGARGCRLTDPVRIGVVDGPVDSQVPALSSVRIESHSVLEAGQTAAAPDHGTGVVSLIAGRASAGVTPGLAQGAHILSAVAFSDTSDGNFASTDGLASALDWLASRDAQVINMSLAGPPNHALGAVLMAMAGRDVVLVAAAGNDGRIGVSYPASDPHVIGISAIDARRRLFVDANRGEEVDFVAPGVEVLVALEGRSAYRSGTSFAAAIATAVIAHSLSRGSVSPDALTERLRAGSEDLGRPGHDTDFGWGLLRLPECQER